MRRDTSAAGEEYEVRDVLVSIMGDEQHAIASLLDLQRTSSDRLGRIPSKDEVNRIIGRSIKALKTKIIVVNEAMVYVGNRHTIATSSFDIFHGRTSGQ